MNKYQQPVRFHSDCGSRNASLYCKTDLSETEFPLISIPINCIISNSQEYCCSDDSLESVTSTCDAHFISITKHDPNNRQGSVCIKSAGAENKEKRENGLKQTTNNLYEKNKPQKTQHMLGMISQSRKSVQNNKFSKHDNENIRDELDDRMDRICLGKSNTVKPNNLNLHEASRKTPRSQKRIKSVRTAFRSKSCERVGSALRENLSCITKSGRSSPLDIEPYDKVKNDSVCLIILFTNVLPRWCQDHRKVLLTDSVDDSMLSVRR